MKIYVLSLARTPERRAAVSAALGGLGLAFDVFDAVDAKGGLEAHAARIDRTGIRRRMRRDLTEGEIACALSHAAIYEDMLAAGHERAIVLEDDAILGPPFAETVRSGALEASGLELVMFFHRSARVWRRPLAVDLPGSHRLYRLVKTATTTVGYYLTRGAAARLLDASLPVSHTADWPMDLAELGAAVVHPRLIGHPDGQAELGQSTLDTGRPPEPARSFAEMASPAYLRYLAFRKPFSRKIS